ncbi:hypothetical protein ES711_05845 [Gelidibacter salicanalis]|uniref:Peptidase M56 domain-containing protein n=1 Tax=Gelidibacter salicanalis TaxID=291193 RepID=A0A5C7ANB1_9FLAO|nr:M56 family metallopeptidase [Gelidibacter salicanalis]TXE09444.1 hypothetical protein ES711_05845 [Gelidibacter salicanalis]
MEYVLKASAILSIFYICYRLFLQRETFYEANRWFLLLGLMTSALLPLMVIPVYIEVPLTPNRNFAAVAATMPHPPEVFDLTSLFIWGYAIGASFFVGRFILQLFSLTTLINKHHKKKTEVFTFIEIAQVSTPFSFFNWIVYNPTQFDAQELDLVLQHEKVHAEQKHSIDVLIMDFTTALFWCNPLIWIYRTSLKQNLEFIADHQTQKQSGCEERYQKLLLKTSVPEEKLISINPFYNSTIKKRIVMLHKSKSNLMNTWKYSIIVPLLAAFALTFNTEIIAQNVSDSNPASATTLDQQNVLTFIVTKDTKIEQMEYITEKLSNEDVHFKFKNIERNSKNEITGIKIKYDYKNKTGTYAKSLSSPIPSIEISVNPTSHNVTIGEHSSGLSQTIAIGSEKDSNHIQNIALKEPLGLQKITHETSNSQNKPLIILKDKEITHVEMQAIDPDTIAHISVLKDENATKSYGDKAKNGVIIIQLKAPTATETQMQPLYILDNEEITKEKMEAIDPDTIESMDILKDDSATKKYGTKGAHGVIIITSKKKK